MAIHRTHYPFTGLTILSQHSLSLHSTHYPFTTLTIPSQHSLSLKKYSQFLHSTHYIQGPLSSTTLTTIITLLLHYHHHLHPWPSSLSHIHLQGSPDPCRPDPKGPASFKNVRHVCVYQCFRREVSYPPPLFPYPKILGQMPLLTPFATAVTDA